MTRDTDGNIVPQCEARYIVGINHVRCVKEQGHDGEHRDTRGNDFTNRDASAAASPTEREEIPTTEE